MLAQEGACTKGVGWKRMAEEAEHVGGVQSVQEHPGEEGNGYDSTEDQVETAHHDAAEFSFRPENDITYCKDPCSSTVCK